LQNNAVDMDFLIVGLGNPGMQYENTRHNVGFMVADKLAARHSIAMKKEASFKGVLGKGKIGSSSCWLLKPTTFMNHSGDAVVLVQHYNKVQISNVLVVSDDVALPYGKLRLREEGSSGGHHGLESVEMRLGTQRYARLRIGVGDREEGDLDEHVLGKFQGEELSNLPNLIEQAAIAVEAWVAKKEQSPRIEDTNCKES
jgi:peptidyl-tRNA hydrolase, PTH1 family